MNIIKISKTLPKRETFICDICGYEKETGAFNPMYLHKTVEDFSVTATVCNDHFGLEDGEIVYTLELLMKKFEVENEAEKGDIFTFKEMREIAQKYIKPKWKRGEQSE